MEDAVTTGMIQGGWGYVWAAYGITWAALAIYLVHVFRQRAALGREK